MRRIKIKWVILLVVVSLTTAYILNPPAPSLASLSAKKMLQCDK